MVVEHIANRQVPNLIFFVHSIANFVAFEMLTLADVYNVPSFILTVHHRNIVGQDILRFVFLQLTPMCIVGPGEHV